MFKIQIETANDAFVDDPRSEDGRPGIGDAEMGSITDDGGFEPTRSRSLISAGFVDVSNIQEYGLTQKLSNSIRCF